MRINTNISALNAWKNLSVTGNMMAKSLEKLSSGYRINKAADDAAGLAISEKMRAQTAGLRQASRNAQDGISLIQTAEGALNETHAILQRMRELMVQANTGTNKDDDLDKIQQEMSQLIDEIDGIANRTEFNTKAPLNGELTAVGGEGGETGSVTTYSIDGTPTDTKGLLDGEINLENFEGPAGEYTIEIEYKSGGEDNKIEKITITGPDSFEEEITNDFDAELAVAGIKFTLTEGAQEGDGTAEITFKVKAETTEGSGESSTGGLNLQIGANSGQTLGISISDMSAQALAVKGIDVTDFEAADFAAQLGKIDHAISTVSTERGKLGALQNRLEHTINNLQAAEENLTAAESRIRDVDMALEMASFIRHQILQQAGTAMLAQANMSPQSVLKLLG